MAIMHHFIAEAEATLLKKISFQQLVDFSFY
jgi:hypothetical protein